jgi:hypothetical protein
MSLPRSNPDSAAEYAKKCCERGMSLIEARRLDEAIA